MLTAVRFQVVSRLGTIKVEVVLAHFVLSPKFVGGESAVTQNGSQLFLRHMDFLRRTRASEVGFTAEWFSR